MSGYAKMESLEELAAEWLRLGGSAGYWERNVRNVSEAKAVIWYWFDYAPVFIDERGVAGPDSSWAPEVSDEDA